MTAFVRDRGKGFDLATVEPGRLGVRESIIGRMARHGGQGRGAQHPRRGHRDGPRGAAGAGGDSRWASCPRVFLVDDHQMFRTGVRAELGDRVEVVGEAADVESAVQGIRATSPRSCSSTCTCPAAGARP